jgi:hypothetical protein
VNLIGWVYIAVCVVLVIVIIKEIYDALPPPGGTPA